MSAGATFRLEASATRPSCSQSMNVALSEKRVLLATSASHLLSSTFLFSTALRSRFRSTFLGGGLGHIGPPPRILSSTSYSASHSL